MKKEEGVAEPATDEKEVVVEKPSSSPASEETNKEETVADKYKLSSDRGTFGQVVWVLGDVAGDTPKYHDLVV
ncbi:hypothetical protein BRADI_1g57160v3 [Brachypodium distachyon]|uniref:Uncharacterized protein n=1 Tax=Brachypodium distachyon TaxID=15368 RepID=I1H3M9_BRADI|nr:hypothetical protein BRADI_1g57160v3 [Brachypodium distachyon]